MHVDHAESGDLEHRRGDDPAAGVDDGLPRVLAMQRGQQPRILVVVRADPFDGVGEVVVARTRRTSRRRSAPGRRRRRAIASARSPRPAPGAPCGSRTGGSCATGPGRVSARAIASAPSDGRPARTLGLGVAHHQHDARRAGSRPPHADEIRARLRSFPREDGEGRAHVSARRRRSRRRGAAANRSARRPAPCCDRGSPSPARAVARSPDVVAQIEGLQRGVRRT